MQATFEGFDDYERRKERARRREADQSRKGRDIGPLPPVADPDRKEACRRNLRLYLETYHADRFNLLWSDDHLRAIALLESTTLDGGLYAYAMARANGKTTLCVATAEWAACYGHRSYIVPIGATSGHAEAMLETIKTDFETRELLLADFPEICYPIARLEGINNRSAGQILNGVRTRVKWTSKRIVLPTVQMDDGSLTAPSGVIIQTAGLLGAMRGMQYTTADGITHRPGFVILDDPQTDDSARSPSQTATRVRIVTKAVLGLAGPDKTIAACCPCTVIVQGDMADQLLNREVNPEWRGEKSGLLRKLPTNMDLWNQYREIRKDSLREFEDIRLATDFYREHQREMSAGAEPSWPQRYQPGQLDAVQYAMDLWAKDEAVFWAEYQNQPLAEDEGDIETLRAGDLMDRMGDTPKGVCPAWAQRITAYIDVQQDALIYWVTAWGNDFHGRVIDYGIYPPQHERYWTLRKLRVTLRMATGTATVEDGLRAGLDELTEQLLDERYEREDNSSAEGMRVELVGIDANWQEHSGLVHLICRKSKRLLACNGRFVGASTLPMADWRKEPGMKPGHFCRRHRTGERPRLEIDINYWKTFTAKRLQIPVGEPGAIDLYFAPRVGHHEVACDQLSAEFGVRVSGRGRRVDEWKNRPGRDNHYWDGMVGCAVLNSQCGGAIIGQAEAKPKVRKSLAELQAEKRNKRGGR